MKMPTVSVVFALLLFASPAAALTISGSPDVTRPYAFTLDGYEVYLVGVDSVEAQQTCTLDRQRWGCWAAAQRELQTLLSLGEVICDSVVGPDDKRRMIATCTVGGQDVGERFVLSGFGLAIPAETDRYDAAQAQAREAELGLWKSRFVPPSIWRSLPMSPNSNRPDFASAAPGQ